MSSKSKIKFAISIEATWWLANGSNSSRLSFEFENLSLELRDKSEIKLALKYTNIIDRASGALRFSFFWNCW